jgi:hypothetical protein
MVILCFVRKLSLIFDTIRPINYNLIFAGNALNLPSIGGHLYDKWRHNTQHDDTQHNDIHHKVLIDESQHKGDSITTLYHCAEWYFAECRVFFVIMLSGITLNVVLLSVMAPNKLL